MRGGRGPFGGRSNEQGGNSQPATVLDLYEKMVDPTVQDPFLGDNNLGLGNYTDREFYEQLSSFRDGLYAEAAFARLLFDRAVYETKCALASEEFDACVRSARGADGTLDDDTEVTVGDETLTVTEKNGIVRVDGHTRNEYLVEAGDRCFNALGDYSDDEVLNPPEAKAAAIEDRAGLSGEWIPPHWRMLLARHETSRSRHAKLLDSVTAPNRDRRDGEGRQRMEPTDNH